MPYDEMSDMIYSGGGAYSEQGLTKTSRRQTIREELNSQIAGLKHMLKNKEDMLKLLDENPVIEKFMDLSRLG